jgi:hypothetical protein
MLFLSMLYRNFGNKLLHFLLIQTFILLFVIIFFVLFTQINFFMHIVMNELYNCLPKDLVNIVEYAKPHENDVWYYSICHYGDCKESKYMYGYCYDHALPQIRFRRKFRKVLKELKGTIKYRALLKQIKSSHHIIVL